jgi:hypothetical protein
MRSSVHGNSSRTSLRVYLCNLSACMAVEGSTRVQTFFGFPGSIAASSAALTRRGNFVTCSLLNRITRNPLLTRFLSRFALRSPISMTSFWSLTQKSTTALPICRFSRKRHLSDARIARNCCLDSGVGIQFRPAVTPACSGLSGNLSGIKGLSRIDPRLRRRCFTVSIFARRKGRAV